MAPCHPNESTISLLRERRSTAADFLGEPGPDEAAVQSILAAASRVPDHRRVTPYRFVVFRGDARARAGDVLARNYKASEPEANAERVEKERLRFLRAPVVVAVVSAVNFDHKTPEWEQILTAGAACQNMLIAASAHGFAAQWLTEWYAYDRDVLEAFGLAQKERIAGFVYIGTASQPPKERARPDLSALISEF
ncbi:MAG: nitroreductase [Pseudomonadota bacterium]